MREGPRVRNDAVAAGSLAERRRPRRGAEPARLRDLALRSGRSGRRPCAGHAAAGPVPLHRFQAGTNHHAWLFTILRNLFHSEHRKRRREVADPDGAFAGRLTVQPNQMVRLDFQDLRGALTMLRHDQREVLLLVGASGFSCNEEATICDYAVDTIKSRVNCACARFAALLHVDASEDFGADRITRAVTVPPG